MINILLTIFVLSSCVGYVSGSEKSGEVIVFDAKVGRLNYNPLRYCDKEYIDKLKKDYDMQCNYNEPFLRIYYPSWEPEELKNIKEQYIKPITYVPFKYFLTEAINQCHDVGFKQSDTILLSFFKAVQNEEREIQIKLDSDFGEMNPCNLLDQFKKQPRCEPGHICNEQDYLLAFVDTTELEKELCDAGFICKSGRNHGYGNPYQKYEQGPNGYFAEEIKAEQAALFYYRLKKFLCGGSIAAVVFMYLLYQQFYVTAE